MRNPITAFTEWASYMYRTFGFNTLSVLFLVYWTQGFKSLSALAVTFFYKETLGLAPATVQFIRMITGIAWFIKPLYGLSSDNIPIVGYHRRSYLLLAGLLGSISLLSMLLINSVSLSIVALMLSELSQAVADVMADAIMVEKSRKDPEIGSGYLQSFSWSILAIGGLCGAIVGGDLLEIIEPRYIIAAAGICPLFLVFAAIRVHELRSDQSIMCSVIKERLQKLCTHIKKPKVFKPMLFILLSRAISPSYGEAMIYFMSDEAGISESFLGIIQAVGYLSLLLGSAGYSMFLKKIPYRKTLFIGQIILCAFGVVDLMFVLKLYEVFRIPAEVFALGENALGETLTFAFRAMPLLVLSAKICPEGVEATLFATFMSIANLSYAISAFFGGVLLEIFGIETGNYGHFWILVCFQAISKLLLIPLIGILPEKIEEDDECLAVFEALDEEMQPVESNIDNS